MNFICDIEVWEWEALDARWANFAKRLAEHEKNLAEGREAYRDYLAGCEESEHIIDEEVRQILGGTGPDNALVDAGDNMTRSRAVKGKLSASCPA